jgi:Flavodoxins
VKCLVVYSSVTGNTRSLAEAIHTVMPPGTGIAPVHKAPAPDDFDFLALGFWVHRAKPDPRMIRYMRGVQNKTIAWFGTLAAWPDSEHARQVRRNTEELLCGNHVIGGFLCQGRLEARRFAAAMNRSSTEGKHPLTEERKAKLLEATLHPNKADFAAAREQFSLFLRQCGCLHEIAL